MRGYLLIAALVVIVVVGAGIIVAGTLGDMVANEQQPKKRP